MTQHQVIEAQATAVAPVQQFNSPAALMMQAAQSGMTPETIEKMMDLQLRFEAEQARRSFVSDFALFAAERPSVYKNKEVKFGNTKYTHATLDNLVDTVGPVAAKHGFSHSWDTKQDGKRVRVTCTLRHRLGHSESVTMEADFDSSGQKNSIQQMGSAFTYLRRYTYEAVTGAATSDEFDDNGVGADSKGVTAINPELLDAAREAAMGGWASLSQFVASKTEQERKELNPESNNLKAAAKAADAAKKGS
jgi:hypothetical protein